MSLFVIVPVLTIEIGLGHMQEVKNVTQKT